MSPDEPATADEIREMDKKDFRKEFPSGWMEVARYETLVLVLDALLESSSSREFTLGELAEKAGASERSVRNHLGSLVELGIVHELVEDREESRYSLNERNPITQKLFELNVTVERVKEGSLPQELDQNPNRRDAPEDTNSFEMQTGGSRLNSQEEHMLISD